MLQWLVPFCKKLLYSSRIQSLFVQRSSSAKWLEIWCPEQWCLFSSSVFLRTRGLPVSSVWTSGHCIFLAKIQLVAAGRIFTSVFLGQVFRSKDAFVSFSWTKIVFGVMMLSWMVMHLLLLSPVDRGLPSQASWGFKKFLLVNGASWSCSAVHSSRRWHGGGGLILLLKFDFY